MCVLWGMGYGAAMFVGHSALGEIEFRFSGDLTAGNT